MWTLFPRRSLLNGEGIAGGLFGGFFGIIWLVVLVLVIAGIWKTFMKAGQPGWAAIIPFYNIIVLLQIAGKPVWWIILCLIPVVNVIAIVMVSIAVAERFGKGAGFGLGLTFLGFIFYPILGFGDAQYKGATPAPAGA